MCDLVWYVTMHEIVCDCLSVGVTVYRHLYLCVNTTVYVCDITVAIMWPYICVWLGENLYVYVRPSVWLWDTERLKLLTHIHTVTKWQNQDLSPGNLAPEALLLIAKLSWSFPHCEGENWGPWVLRVLESIVCGLGLGPFWT